MKPNTKKASLRFVGIENATPDWLKKMIPTGWNCRYEPYTVQWEKPTPYGYKSVPLTVEQWKFTSPDGSEELRIHQGDPRFTDQPFVARWGVRYTGQKEYEIYKCLEDCGGPIYVGKNPHNPKEMWIYYDNQGQVVPFCSDSGHIPLKQGREAQFAQKMHGLVNQMQQAVNTYQ